MSANFFWISLRDCPFFIHYPVTPPWPPDHQGHLPHNLVYMLTLENSTSRVFITSENWGLRRGEVWYQGILCFILLTVFFSPQSQRGVCVWSQKLNTHYFMYVRGELSLFPRTLGDACFFPSGPPCSSLWENPGRDRLVDGIVGPATHRAGLPHNLFSVFFCKLIVTAGKNHFRIFLKFMTN